MNNNCCAISKKLIAELKLIKQEELKMLPVPDYVKTIFDSVFATMNTFCSCCGSELKEGVQKPTSKPKVTPTKKPEFGPCSACNGKGEQHNLTCMVCTGTGELETAESQARRASAQMEAAQKSETLIAKSRKKP
jgi:hypothetical protein